MPGLGRGWFRAGVVGPEPECEEERPGTEDDEERARPPEDLGGIERREGQRGDEEASDDREDRNENPRPLGATQKASRRNDAEERRDGPEWKAQRVGVTEPQAEPQVCAGSR